MKKQLVVGSALVISTITVPVMAHAGLSSNTTARTNSNDGIAEKAEHQNTAVVAAAQNHGSGAQVASVAHSSNGTSSDDKTPVPTDSIATKEEATATAQATFPDKTVKEVEQESEHGSSVWEIKFTDGSKVEIDAITGAVTESKDITLASNLGASDDHGRSGRSGRDHPEDN